MRQRTRSWGSVAVMLATLVVIPAWAQSGELPSVCSLTWNGLQQSLGPGTGWGRVVAPILVGTTSEGTPAYQAELFEQPSEHRMLLIIAKWGEPDSPNLGDVVYCTVRAADGQMLEEVGQNPLPEVPTAHQRSV